MHAKIGDAVRRKEDARLITGRGCYSDDINLPDQAYAAALRAPHAHALIRAIDVEAARAMPGVLAVLTGNDARADGLKPIPHPGAPGTAPDIVLKNRDGSAVPVAPHPGAADRSGPPRRHRRRLRHRRDDCSSKGRGRDASSSTRPAAGGDRRDGRGREQRAALYDDLPNIMIDAEVGDTAATARHLREPLTSRGSTPGSIVSPVCRWSRAPRSAAMIPQRTLHALRRLRRHRRQKRELAAILGVPRKRYVVIAREIGGNFGTRNGFFPEFALVAWGSRGLGRPVKWTCERHEAFLSDYMGRDLTVSAELALDADGRFLALRSSNLSNIGGHSASYVPLVKGVGLATPATAFLTRYPSARRAVDDNVHYALSQRRAARGDLRHRTPDR